MVPVPRTSQTQYAQDSSRPLERYEHGSDLWEPCNVPVSAWVNHRCPERHVTHLRDFPESLRAYLMRTGYFSS